MRYTWGESLMYEASPSCMMRDCNISPGVKEVNHTPNEENPQTSIKEKICRILNVINDDLVLGRQIDFSFLHVS